MGVEDERITSIYGQLTHANSRVAPGFVQRRDPTIVKKYVYGNGLPRDQLFGIVFGTPDTHFDTKKTSTSLKLGFAVGAPFGIYEALIWMDHGKYHLSPRSCGSMLVQSAKYGSFGAAAMGMYTAVSTSAAIARQKDDPLNSFLGAYGIASVWNAYDFSFKHYLARSFWIGLSLACVKYMYMHDYPILQEPNQCEEHQGALLRMIDVYTHFTRPRREVTKSLSEP